MRTRIVAWVCIPVLGVVRRSGHVEIPCGPGQFPYQQERITRTAFRRSHTGLSKEGLDVANRLDAGLLISPGHG